MGRSISWSSCVSSVRGGRPDLAAEKLPAVTAPTLLLVGLRRQPCADVNESALHLLGSVGCSELVMMLHAGHLFEGPGQLDEMADRAAEWLKQHLTSRH